MDPNGSSSISPEEFRKLQMQVDILQRFLTKTFGSSFLEFCKEAKLSLMKNGNGSPNKPLPTLNKVQVQTAPISSAGGLVSVASSSNGTSKVKVEIKSDRENNMPSTSAGSRRPPPLLHRPGSANIKRGGSLTIIPGGNNVARVGGATNGKKALVSNNLEEEETDSAQIELYGDGNEDGVQFIQPETVFSDDEQQQATSSSQGKNTRNGIKRDHAAAFGYDKVVQEETMDLPEGTECILIDSGEDQGQLENYDYQQGDEMYDVDGTEDGPNEDGGEYYDEEGFSYSMLQEGLEVPENGTSNYSSEELRTDGNVTFGTVITAQDTGVQYFQCSFCPSAKVFKHKQSLKEHYLLNHSPTPPAFQCQCGRRFLKQSQLKRHEVVHTAERPYVCPICFKDFTRKDNMTVHMVRNHAEKKHPCPYCPDKIYATPAEVNRHLRMYHSQWQQ